ncbi:MAG: Tfx family DNA-binding protein [Halobacteriales archaeon]
MTASGEKIESTFLTQRQVEILSLRGEGLTQETIADRLGTSVPNISSIEQSARRNIEKAERTVALARVLRSQVSFTAEAGTDLRNLVDTIYRRGDETDTRVDYTDPELSAHLHDQLEAHIEGRQLTTDIEIGLTADGDVLLFPVTGAAAER